MNKGDSRALSSVNSGMEPAGEFLLNLMEAASRLKISEEQLKRDYKKYRGKKLGEHYFFLVRDLPET